MLEPKRSHGLMSENLVPVVRSRSADVFQKALPVIRVIGNDRRCFLVTARFLFRSSLVLVLESIDAKASMPAALPRGVMPSVEHASETVVLSEAYRERGIGRYQPQRFHARRQQTSIHTRST